MIQPPQPPTPVKPVPIPEDPPSLQDVTNAINYADTIRLGYRTPGPGCPTDEDLANAFVYQSEAWFNSALDVGLEKRLKPLEEKIDQVKTELGQVKTELGQVKTELDHTKEELRENSHTTNQTYNLQCDTGEFRPYKLIRFIDGTLPPDHHQLRRLYTVQDIRRLSARQVTKYLDGYGLPSDSDKPKEAIANAIGCSVDL